MTVRLDNCRFYAYHGILPQERTAGNEFEVSVEVDYNVIRLNDDNISTTISYADIYDIVRQEMECPRNLLESVAASITEKILFLAEKSDDRLSARLTQTRVQITKITPPIQGINGSASVKLTRIYNSDR